MKLVPAIAKMFVEEGVDAVILGRPRQMDEHDHGYHSNLNKSAW